jgi:hypothetical protein
VSHAPQRIVPRPARTCGACAVCCLVLGIAELDKAVRAPCQHQRGRGCARYDSRPRDCRAFRCLWLAGGLLPPDRPDLSGVMFEPRAPASGGSVMLVAHEATAGSFGSMELVGRVLKAVGALVLHSFDGTVSEVRKRDL